MARHKSWFFIIRREVIDESPTSVVLDMLRYDAARPLSNPPSGYYLFRSDINAPTVERWRSHGIVVASVQQAIDQPGEWVLS